METKILRVVRQGEAFSVQSKQSENGQIRKGDVVVATLRFSTHEYQGQTFQEILATDIVKVN